MLPANRLEQLSGNNMTEDLSLFQEIDESLRVENFERFLRRYGKLIIAACVGIIVITALSVLWKDHTRTNNAKSTSVILQGIELSEARKYTEAEKKFEEVEHSGARNIATVAKFKHAEILLAAKQFDKASVLYKEIAGDAGADKAIRNFAALNSGLIANNIMPGETQRAVSGSDQPFSSLEQELYALRLQKDGKPQEAREVLDRIMNNPELLTSERQRAMNLRDSIRGKNQ